MGDYSLKVVPTTTSSAKFVKDKLAVGERECYDYKTGSLAKRDINEELHRALSKIPNTVNSQGIDIQSPYNGYNNLVAKVDNSKTKVVNENGFWGFCCTKRTITYYDKEGKLLFTRHIDEDNHENTITFRGENGCQTTLYDNNNNGNFEVMNQRSLTSEKRQYFWHDKTDNKAGNYDTVTFLNRASMRTTTTYHRVYDFNQEKVVDRTMPYDDFGQNNIQGIIRENNKGVIQD